MPQSISKSKIYLYLFFLIFLSSIFNFKIIKSYNDKFSLKTININGLSHNEKKNIEIELNKLKNINIFKLTEDKVLEKLAKFNFLEKINVNKIIPSSININLSKTSIVGSTLKDGEKYFIGENKQLIHSDQLNELIDIAVVFGDFQIEDYLNLLKVLKKHKLDIKNIKNFYYFKNKRWDLLFSNGLLLKLPSYNIEKSFEVFKGLLDTNNLKNIKVVDLRVNNQVILKNNNEKF